MTTIYLKASPNRWQSFRAWLCPIAGPTLCGHNAKLAREVEALNLADMADRVATLAPRPRRH
jgi:hypothetical protein